MNRFESQYVLVNTVVVQVLRILYLTPLMLMFALNAHAEPLKIPAIVAIAGQSFDLVSTHQAIGNGCHEANPILTHPDGSFAYGKAIAFKGGITATGIIIMAVGHKTHNKSVTQFGKILSYGIGATGAAAGVWNVSQCGF